MCLAPHVAAGAPRTPVDRVGLAHVPQPAHGLGVHTRQPALAQHVPGTVAELDLDPAAMHEVGLLLALVHVPVRGETGWEDDGVDPECGHSERAPDLAE